MAKEDGCIYMKESMENISSEVLIYLQNVKNYFNNNDNIKDYFIPNNDEELFYSHLKTVSQTNFDKTGQPMLTVDQFEGIRRIMLNVPNIEKKYISYPLYQDFKEFGRFYLN